MRINTLPLMLPLVILFGCVTRNERPAANESTSASSLEGTIAIDGSSTVYPITEAMAEEFSRVHPGVRVTVGVSGTGGGFEKFLGREIDINDASRPIKPTEAATAKERGIGYVELPVAYDGIVMAVHPANGFVDHLTVAELKKIWEPGSPVRWWSDIRHGWPEKDIHLYGPGTDSGTFDYFTEVIVGKARSCRADYTASEDDNVLVRGIGGDTGSLGFVGFAYYAGSRDQLRAVPIQHEGPPVEPTLQSIEKGTYAPLSRPVFLYASAASLQRPEVRAFLSFYLEQIPTLVPQVGYVPLPGPMLQDAGKRLQLAVGG